ncbi:MAG TPA: hypothetical protein VML55_09715, partial [Planctomycetaceae bacterium]|nr:hypothetical protein [Planctomycetaceae bacterium]
GGCHARLHLQPRRDKVVPVRSERSRSDARADPFPAGGRFSSEPLATRTILLLMGGGPLAGVLLGLLWPRSWRAAARAVDVSCQLKDRAVTALEFASRSDAPAWRELQLRDAAAHLQAVDPGRVVPFRLPRVSAFAAVVFAAAIGLLVWPLPARHAAAGQPVAHVGIVSIFEDVDERIDGLEELAADTDDEDLRELVERLRELSQEMKQPGIEVRDALAALSEMQATLAVQQAGLGKLSEAASEMADGIGGGQGGQCNSNSLAEGRNPQKSTSPTNSFGRGTSGNVFGDPTDLESTRNLVEVTGEQGDGPSDVETTTSPEAREQARRAYRESFEKFQKLSEAVLDAEPIPLGHRQTIRRYFELIRPDSAP